MIIKMITFTSSDEVEFIPFMEECSAIIERVLDEEITAFQTLYDTCHAQSVKDSK